MEHGINPIDEERLVVQEEHKHEERVLKEVSKRDIKNLQNKMYDLQFIDDKEFYVKRNY